MNIVLIGYRGTGKSSVARMLGAKLNRPVLSTDAEIVRCTNLSIPEIIQQFGWDHFRNLESDVCKNLASRNDVVIDTGGGAILHPQNVASLKTNGVLVWLTAEAETIRSRIGEDTQRPSLTGTKSFTEEIEEVMQERRPKYQAAADHIIVTDNRSLGDVAGAIVALIKPAAH
jgi:shikimate kinase